MALGWLTQDALAARAGYSGVHAARLERGERRPTESTTWRLAKAITETRKGNMAAMALGKLGLGAG